MYDIVLIYALWLCPNSRKENDWLEVAMKVLGLKLLSTP
jgi:hypothetical protein